MIVSGQNLLVGDQTPALGRILQIRDQNDVGNRGRWESPLEHLIVDGISPLQPFRARD